MTKRSDSATAAMLIALCEFPAARLIACAEGRYVMQGAAKRRASIDGLTVRSLRAHGLLVEAEPGRFAATADAKAWLSRWSKREMAFRAQHSDIGTARVGNDEVLLDLDESPVATLARVRGAGKKAWLRPDQVAAAERFRRDFELGRLQPRVTANWSASVNDGRRTGDGLTNLTEMAIAARRRIDNAMAAVGPELSGVLIDVCCFLKGLETVERERQWPARSAKLVLRLGLQSLARHYGLADSATGARSGTRHWGADGYRPTVS